MNTLDYGAGSNGGASKLIEASPIFFYPPLRVRSIGQGSAVEAGNPVAFFAFDFVSETGCFCMTDNAYPQQLTLWPDGQNHMDDTAPAGNGQLQACCRKMATLAGEHQGCRLRQFIIVQGVSFSEWVIVIQSVWQYLCQHRQFVCILVIGDGLTGGLVTPDQQQADHGTGCTKQQGLVQGMVMEGSEVGDNHYSTLRTADTCLMALPLRVRP